MHGTHLKLQPVRNKEVWTKTMSEFNLLLVLNLFYERDVAPNKPKILSAINKTRILKTSTIFSANSGTSFVHTNCHSYCNNSSIVLVASTYVVNQRYAHASIRGGNNVRSCFALKGVVVADDLNPFQKFGPPVVNDPRNVIYIFTSLVTGSHTNVVCKSAAEFGEGTVMHRVRYISMYDDGRVRSRHVLLFRLLLIFNQHRHAKK